MKNITAARLFFLFISYFLMSLILGAIASFISYAIVSLLLRLFTYLFETNTAYLMQKILPGIAFAISCAILAAGQFYMTFLLNRVLNDKVLAFSAMCVGSFFCSNSFLRYSAVGLFTMYPMRWLPCEIAAFIAGIYALSAAVRNHVSE